VILASGWVLFTMAAIFLGLGYIGVPVPFALMTGVSARTSISPAKRSVPALVPLPPTINSCVMSWCRSMAARSS
jgi:hypothetical protein